MTLFRGKALTNVVALAGIVLTFSLIALENAPGDAEDRLVNVSYDPTRELYQAINPLFIASYAKETGRHVTIVQSHGGSSTQARKVINGEQPADVVTLGFFSDVDALRKHGLIPPGWTNRLPNRSVPYTSTIAFVVRKGNPFHIKDWPDLLTPGVQIVAMDPRSSAAGKLTALAAWASIVTRGGSESDARTFIKNLYQHVVVLSAAARSASISFSFQNTGDVLLTWENEAIREASESHGDLQIVYPPVSFLAEPNVAWLDKTGSGDKNVDAAEAYSKFLFTDPAQKTMARLGYRPYEPGAEEKAGVSFPNMKLVSVEEIAGGWDAANEKFFSEDGIINTLIGAKEK